jgi:tetratricopeptide (TPR) repeat protein
VRTVLSSVLILGLGLCACDGGEPQPPAAADPAEFEKLRNHAFRLFDAGGDLVAIREALAAAYVLRPDAYGVNWRLGQVHADLKLNSEALDHYEAAWAARQDDGDILLRVITLQTELGRDEDALALMPGLAAFAPLAGEALALEATLRDHRGERDLALALVERAAELEPALAYRAQSLHGRFLMQAGDLDGAHERFSSALAGRADYKEAVKGLADTCQRLGREAEAAHWQQVLSLLLDLTDDVMARKKKVMRRNRLEQLVELHPQWEGAFQQLADLQRNAGDTDQACATIETYIALHGTEWDPLDVIRLRQRYCSGAGG